MNLERNDFFNCQIGILSKSETLTFETYRFAKIRELYFNHLKRVIRDNVDKCCQTTVSEDVVEQLSSTLEQPVLLACMEREIYQRLMNDMILQIKRLTEEGVTHVEIEKMLNNILDDKTADLMKQTEIKDSLIDIFCKDDSVSENCPEKHNKNDVFDGDMRRNVKEKASYDEDVRAGIIGILENDSSSGTSIINDQKLGIRRDQVCKSKVKSTFWKHERIIQMHYMFLILSRKSEEEKLRNEIIFLNLFGEDSDVDESSNRDYQKSCLERISAWVVKYLMPYYQEKRIVGRNIFKKLGCLISEKIIQKTDYPEEQFIRHFIKKFFRNNKAYKHENDLLHVKMR